MKSFENALFTVIRKIYLVPMRPFADSLNLGNSVKASQKVADSWSAGFACKRKPSLRLHGQKARGNDRNMPLFWGIEMLGINSVPNLISTDFLRRLKVHPRSSRSSRIVRYLAACPEPVVTCRVEQRAVETVGLVGAIGFCDGMSRRVQPPDAENRMSAGVAEVTGAIPSPRADRPSGYAGSSHSLRFHVLFHCVMLTAAPAMPKLPPAIASK